MRNGTRCAPQWAAPISLRRNLIERRGWRAREDELEDAIRTWTAQRSADDAMECLQAAGVGAAAVRVPANCSPSQALSSGYWAALSASLSVRNRIRTRPGCTTASVLY